MAENKVRLNHVKSCNLGQLGTDGVALKINFATSAGELEKGPYRSAVFGLTPELARGLAKALAAVLDDAKKPPAKPTQN